MYEQSKDGNLSSFLNSSLNTENNNNNNIKNIKAKNSNNN